ncbi:MAG: transposase [Bacteroidia bacterium]
MTPNRKSKQSFRLRSYDYHAEGAYFITICTQKHQPFLGQIRNGKMHLNEAGEILTKEWLLTSEIRESLTIQIDEFCVMPNHFHALIVIDSPILPDKNGRFPSTYADPTLFQSPSQSLGAIVRGFKASCTRQIRAAGIHNFKWQKNYYDHIVRDHESFERIRAYIQNNPANWDKDELFIM